MSGWIDLTNQADGDPVLCQHLHRDDGCCLGIIVRYDWRPPVYAWGKTIGVYPTDQAGRDIVEARLGLVRQQPKDSRRRVRKGRRDSRG
jgi:hypothetical protein